MKKYLCKLPLILLLLGVLTACGGESVSLLNFIEEETSDIDLGGLTFRIMVQGDEGLDYIVPGQAPTERQEKLLNRLDDIEKNHNCTIICSVGRMDEYATYYISGIPTADLLKDSIKYVYTLYNAGYFIPLNDIPNIDMSDGKYGSEDFIESFTWKGDVIGFTPQHWGYMLLDFNNIVFYNSDFFSGLGLANPNEYREQGIWNWDTLEMIGETAASASTAERPLYAAVCNDNFPRMMLLSNGAEFIEIDNNGKYYYALTNSKATDALQFTYDLIKKGYIEPTSADNQVIFENFVEGRYGLATEWSHVGYSQPLEEGTKGGLVYQTDALGYCYPPDGPNAEDNTHGRISNETQIYCVTREKAEDTEALGNFLELLCAPLDEVAGDWKYEFIQNNFFDDASAEVFMTMFESAVFDRVCLADQDGTIFTAVENAAKTGAISENTQKIESRMNANLDAGINSWK